MAKKPDYAALFTLRADGRYMGYWKDRAGKRHAIYDRDPERLFFKLQEKENETPPILSFKEAAEAWQARHWERVGSNTADAYKAPLRRLITYYDGVAAADVTAQSIQALLAELGRQGFSRRTVQMHRDALNMIFNNAILEGRLNVNPCVAVTIPRNLPTKRRELPEDAAIEAVKEHGNLPFGLFGLVCLYAGLRRGEALALCYEDIDREKKLIHVTKAIEFIGNTPHIKSPKTEAGRRDVILLDALEEQLPKGKGLIFCREDGKPLTKTQFRKRWLAYCKGLGHDLTAHQLRHGFATILYEAGIQDKDAQELLGHSSIAVTRDVYTHIRQRQRDETAKRLNEYLSKTAKK